MNKIISNPFEIVCRDNILILTIKENVYNNQWYFYFGEIEKVILNGDYQKFLLKFCNCNYISPNFIISLRIALELANKADFNVEVVGADTDFIKYCTQEKFFIYNDVPDLNNWHYSKNYITVLPLTIIDLKKIQDINVLVEELIASFRNLDSIFSNKFDEDFFKIRIQNILFELIDNTDKYAYGADESIKPIGVYLRLLKSNSHTKEIWQIGNEINNKKMAEEVMLSSKIELYFQDIGRGLVNGYKEKYDIKIDSKRPLKEIFKKIYFYSGLEQERRDNTNIRGLQYIGKILEKGRNYLMVYENYEWVGSYLTNPETNLHSAFSLNDYDLSNDLKGLSYTFYLDLPNKSVVDKRTLETCGGELLNTLSISKSTEINVVDRRNCVPNMSEDGEIIEPELNNKRIINSELSVLFLFLGRISSKHSLIWSIKKAVSKRPGVSTAIICDVQNLEMDLAIYSITNTKVDVIGQNIKNIFLVSETLALKAFEARDGRFILKNQIIFNDFNKQTNYIYNIKYYETFVLMKLQEKNAFGQYMITSGQIKWNEKTVLNGYINFDILTSSPQIFQFLKNNLKRILPLFGFPRLVPLDNMVARLTDEVNAELSLEPNDRILYLGSVYVSGVTSQSNSLNNNISLHFFNRNIESKIFSIFLSPEKLLQSQKSGKTFVRIGKSYKIIEENNLYKKINSRSFLDKKSTYELFDKNYYNPIICNHANFYGKHYILDIDILKIYQDKNSKMQDFLLHLFDSSLGHYFNTVTVCDPFFEELQDCCGVVYLSHHYTDNILSSVLEYRCNYAKYIVGLNHINLFRHEQSLEFSSVYGEYLIKLINDFKQKQSNKEKDIKFIVFDTLINSGRTRKEIKLYLQSLGVDRVIFVSLIDSQEQRYDKSNNNYCFMVAPCPNLGSNSSCPICETIGAQKVFSKSIIAPELVVRLNELCATWECDNLIVARNVIENINIEPISSNEIILPYSQYAIDSDMVFDKVLTLYLFISEQIRQLNDFWIFDNFLDHKFTTLNKDAGALILALFTLEFYNQSYIKLKLKVLKLMIEIMGSVNNTKISSLCYIVLAQHKKDIVNVFESIDLNNLRLSPELHLLLLYCFYYPTKSTPANLIKKFNIGLSVALESEIKGGKAKIDSYKQLHCQLVNINGDTHDSPLLKFINLGDSQPSNKTGISSLELLKQSLETDTIKFDALFGSNLSSEQYQKIIEQINILISKNDKNEKICEKARQIFNAALEIHAQLIAPLGIGEKYSNSERNIINKIRRIVDEYNKENLGKEVVFDNDYEFPVSKYSAKELFYIFNNMLAQEIKYGLDNIRKHCFEKDKCKIKKIKYNGGDKDEYAALLAQEIKEEYINVDIINNVEKPIDNVNLKLRYEKEELKNLGITIKQIKKSESKFSDLFDETCFILRITFPNINFI